MTAPSPSFQYLDLTGGLQWVAALRDVLDGTGGDGLDSSLILGTDWIRFDQASTTMWQSPDASLSTGTPDGGSDNTMTIYRKVNNGGSEYYQIRRATFSFFDGGTQSPSQQSANMISFSGPVIDGIHTNTALDESTFTDAATMFTNVDTSLWGSQLVMSYWMAITGGDGSQFQGTAAEMVLWALDDLHHGFGGLRTDITSPTSWPALLNSAATAITLFKTAMEQAWNTFTTYRFADPNDLVAGIVNEISTQVATSDRSSNFDNGTATADWTSSWMFDFTSLGLGSYDLGLESGWTALNQAAMDDWRFHFTTLQNASLGATAALNRSLDALSNALQRGVSPWSHLPPPTTDPGTFGPGTTPPPAVVQTVVPPGTDPVDGPTTVDVLTTPDTSTADTGTVDTGSVDTGALDTAAFDTAIFGGGGSDIGGLGPDGATIENGLTDGGLSSMGSAAFDLGVQTDGSAPLILLAGGSGLDPQRSTVGALGADEEGLALGDLVAADGGVVGASVVPIGIAADQLRVGTFTAGSQLPVGAIDGPLAVAPRLALAGAAPGIEPATRAGFIPPVGGDVAIGPLGSSGQPAAPARRRPISGLRDLLGRGNVIGPLGAGRQSFVSEPTDVPESIVGVGDGMATAAGETLPRPPAGRATGDGPFILGQDEAPLLVSPWYGSPGDERDGPRRRRLSVEEDESAWGATGDGLVVVVGAEPAATPRPPVRPATVARPRNSRVTPDWPSEPSEAIVRE